MKLKEWGMFLLLSLIWGFSFLWIKVALGEIGPLTLVGYRLIIAVVGLTPAVLLSTSRFPHERKAWLRLIILGIFNPAIPFLLISWSEQFIDSAVASILNGTIPLFTVVLAYLFLKEERITLQSVAGLLIGFLGVVVLVSRELLAEAFAQGILGQIAVLVSSLLYAASTIYIKRYLSGVSLIMQTFTPMFSAGILVWSLIPAIENPIRVPESGQTWIAISWLGLLGTVFGYLIYYALLHSIGPTRTSLVSYVFPVIGVILGVVILREQLDLQLVIGSLLVVNSVVVVNWKSRKGEGTSNTE